jgi:hypothetical protein
MPDQRPARRRGSWWCAGRVVGALLIGSVLPACGRPASRVPAGAIAPEIASDWDAGRCAPSPIAAAPRVDADADALDDGCELALAGAFAPELVVDPTECLWLADARPARLAGGYLFAARPLDAGAVRLAYLPAYSRDCGWDGTACRLRPGGCGAHAGDSELLVLDVAPTAREGGRWAVVGVFLSAHCGGRSAGRCRWYRGAELDRFTWTAGESRGAPRVWVARGKHAHYASARDCDRGHWGYDACDRNTAVVRFPIRSAAQNLGSRTRPIPAPDGCRTASALPLGSAGLEPTARECPWDATRPFRGWQADTRGRGPTSYGRSLAEVAGF